MKVTVLVDNISGKSLGGEWGLSFYIEYRDKVVLLDTGLSGLFAENADRLGLDLNAVDYAVLSHAHDDHANGFDTFFERNDHAPLFVARECGENCYDFDAESQQEAVFYRIQADILDRAHLQSSNIYRRSCNHAFHARQISIVSVAFLEKVVTFEEIECKEQCNQYDNYEESDFLAVCDFHVNISYLPAILPFFISTTKASLNFFFTCRSWPAAVSLEEKCP